MATSSPNADGEQPERRRYDSTLRQEKAADTRRQIVAAGIGLLHASDVRNWDVLSIRAVAERAGVHERTIYRHFGTERGMRDAVMKGLEDQAGVVLEGMQLEDVAKVATRIFEHVSSFPLPSRPALDPTLTEANRRQHSALMDAVAGRASGWSSADQTMAAGILDVLWSVAAYERLVRDWELDPARAIEAINWVIEMVEFAIGHDRRPTEPH